MLLKQTEVCLFFSQCFTKFCCVSDPGLNPRATAAPLVSAFVKRARLTSDLGEPRKVKASKPGEGLCKGPELA